LKSVRNRINKGFTGTEQGILGSDVLFLGKEKHYAEKELQAKQ